jgi:hypothetical protein
MSGFFTIGPAGESAISSNLLKQKKNYIKAWDLQQVKMSVAQYGSSSNEHLDVAQ